MGGERQARPVGREVRAGLWLARHPTVWVPPAVLGAGTLEVGPQATAATVAGLAAAGAAWWRAHPATFDRHAAPRLRAAGARWGRYGGRRWRTACDAVGLVFENRRTHEVVYPRVLRVDCPTPSIDLVMVKLAPGQSARIWQDCQDELAVMLGAETVSITRVKPKVLALTVLRGNPFDAVVPAVMIPDTVEDVDLRAVELGDTEYGQPWCEPFHGTHVLVHGATGSGKSGLIWNPLRAMGPMIREGLVRVWMIDPKGGMETACARPLFYRWADHVEDDDDDDDDDGRGGSSGYRGESALTLVRDFRDSMRRAQSTLTSQGLRKAPVTRDHPLDLLMIDEFMMLSAFSSRTAGRELMGWLGEILTQGRASNHMVAAYTQEPTKDILPVRDLFPRRVCLATTSAAYVDMVLGEDARQRGALADEIPLDDEHAGIGFRVAERSRIPMRVRAGHVSDADVAELVRLCAPPDVNTVRLAA